MLVVALVCLVAFAVWFAVEPRVVWPGFLLTFGLAALVAEAVLWLGVASTLPVVGLPFGLVLVVLAMVLLGSPVIVGVFLIANFVLMLRKEGRTRATLLSGLVGAGTLAYVTAFVVAYLLQWDWQAFVLGALGLPLLAVAVGFVSFLIYSNFYTWWFGRFGGQVSAIVVLGGALRGRTVSPLLGRRIDKGLELARRQWNGGREIPIIMSGGQGADEEVSEASAMAEYAQGRGVPSERIWLEERSTTTAENLAFTAELLCDKGIHGPVVVATNDYHAFRAATMMRRAKVPGYALGYRTARYYWPAATIREYLAVLRDHRLFVSVVLGLLLLPLLIGLASFLG